MNHGSGQAHIALPATMSDVLHDGRRVISVDLASQGVAVLTTDGR
jgi:hypothetical protein